MAIVPTNPAVAVVLLHHVDTQGRGGVEHRFVSSAARVARPSDGAPPAEVPLTCARCRDQVTVAVASGADARRQRLPYVASGLAAAAVAVVCVLLVLFAGGWEDPLVLAGKFGGFAWAFVVLQLLPLAHGVNIAAGGDGTGARHRVRGVEVLG